MLYKGFRKCSLQKRSELNKLKGFDGVGVGELSGVEKVEAERLLLTDLY